MPLRHAPGLLAATFLLLAGPSLQARMMGISWDNDAVFGTDGSYSNGLRISWLGDEQDHEDCPHCLTMRLADRLDWLPGFQHNSARYAASINVEQLMLTPSDITVAERQPDDIPYVGVLRVEAGLFARREHSLTGYFLSGGVIGPSSGAGSLQRRIHEFAGVNRPAGWDNQLGEDPLVGVAVVHTRQLRQWRIGDGLQAEASVNWRARADTFSAYGHSGVFFRFGHNLPGNQLPDYAGLGSPASMPGLFYYRNAGWTLFGGLAAEVTPYSYIKENSEDHEFEHRRFHGIATVGLAAHTRGLHLSLTLKETTSQTAGLRKPYRFGTLSLIWLF